MLLRQGMCVLATVLACLSLARAHGQAKRPEEDRTRTLSSKPIAFEGLVLAADGEPAEGAVVMGSAGGKALADVEGHYRLEARVPLDAERVQITAFGVDGNRSAVAEVELAGASPFVWVDPLLLVQGADCRFAWTPTFGGQPGTDGPVRALQEFDDGGGTALFLAGDFEFAGGVAARMIVKWDGSRWSPLGSGIGGNFSTGVYSLAVFDDGTGPALYAGGDFSMVDGVPTNHLARWDGTSWSAVGNGPNGVNGLVYAMHVFDDGDGPALYVGGFFTRAAGVPARMVAKWDGSAWSGLGEGMDDEVNALSVFDDGAGPALHAGGSFTMAGGVAASRVAKWDGVGWTSLGSGTSAEVDALAVFDDGAGPALYAGGAFTTAGGVPADRIARWDGSSWMALSGGVNEEVRALHVFDDGAGAALYAGGAFSTAGGLAASRIAKWDGAAWSALGSGIDQQGALRALAVFDDGNGPALHAAGAFTGAGGTGADRIARWDGSSWSGLRTLEDELNGAVDVLAVCDDGSGPALYAGGYFTVSGAVPTNHIARWNGSTWSALGSGMNGLVSAVAVYDDGGGPALYAGGDFSHSGSVPTNHVARWDGAAWSALDGGLNNSVSALVVFDGGSGAALHAGGQFTRTHGNVTVNGVARWNGASWSPLGLGVDGVILAFSVFDDGSGPALYAAGSFGRAGLVPANRIARWNGSTWSALGSGLDFWVHALTVFDDGTGSALYAAGSFTAAGGVSANRIAKWDGATWQPLGSGLTGFPFQTVNDLAVFDEGSGPALYAGGIFTSAGGVAAMNIARWDGSAWSPLRTGIGGSVVALAAFDDGNGPALLAGGSFSSAPSRDSYIARWGCPFALFLEKLRKR